MLNKLKQLIKYVAYFLFSSATYALVLYFVYSQLAEYSLLYAYLGNLALIIFALASDSITFKTYEIAMQSKKYVEKFKKSSFVRFHLDAFVSYKTTLYIFYIVILLLSQIVNSNPTLISDDLMNFISANEYGILLLIAVDLLIGQFSKDREKSKRYQKTVEEYLSDNQD